MSKPLKENYIIRIKSCIEQFDSEGNMQKRKNRKSHIELMTRGNLVQKGRAASTSPTKRRRPLASRAAPPPSRSPRTAAGWLMLRFGTCGEASTQLLIEREQAQPLPLRDRSYGSLTLGVTGGRASICNLTEKGGSCRVQLPAGRRRRPPCQPQHAGNDRTTCELTSQALTRQLSCQESPWHVGPVLLFRLRLPNHVGPAFKRKGHLTND